VIKAIVTQLNNLSLWWEFISACRLQVSMFSGYDLCHYG